MLKEALKDLKRSGISAKQAEFAEMYSVEDASEVYPDFKPYKALVIPYHNPWSDDYFYFERDGKKLPFCRVRYYLPQKKVHGFKKKKALRYSQPANSGVFPYFPQVPDIDWLDVAADPEVPIMITEGEKKSLAACIAGIPTIGLGGVYNFAHDGELLPILDEVDWNQRTVFICYDSDAQNNNKIQVAEGRLATELSLKRNASVFLVRLPELPGGAKMGVDDFLEAKGEDALFDLLDKAPQMRQIDREVLRMNTQVAWIDKEGLLLNLETDTWMKKSDFTKGSEFSTRTIAVPAQKGGGVKHVSVADAWLTHPHARRYTDTIFKPDTSDKAVKLPRGGVAYNRFRGLKGVEGDVEPFFQLYDWLMSRTDEFDHDLIWKVICYKVQNLAARIDLGLILLGPQGSGKSFFTKIIAEMVEPYDKVMSSNELGSDFNGWIETSLIIIMNEAKSNQLKYNMDRLKTYITERRQPMNEKYRANRQVESYGLYVFNSNERNAGAFPDDDRRMIILGCPGPHPEGDAFYDRVGDWYDNNGPKKLLHFFQNFDLQGWKPPSKAPQTREKRMAYYASLTPVQKIGDAIKKSDENLIVTWITAALEWASSEQVGNTPYQITLASQIAETLRHIQIRPFYTPEELALMFPSISGTLSLGKVKDATPANVLAQELIQVGVDYLRCEENFDGFYYKGQIRQYLIISDHDKFDDPISQDDFDEMMASFPTYNEWRAQKRRKARKKRKKRNR